MTRGALIAYPSKGTAWGCAPARLNLADSSATAMSSILSRDHRLEAILQSALNAGQEFVFPLNYESASELLGFRHLLPGQVWVVNMSSGGVLIASKHEISVGARVEMNIEWPYLLDWRVPLRLVAEGRVVRSETSSFALVLARHQFRTAKTVIPRNASRGEACNQTAKKAVGA
jgi:hypothetical protein